MDELWVPYCRELGEVVESEGLADGFEIADELGFEPARYRMRVAVNKLDV